MSCDQVGAAFGEQHAVSAGADGLEHLTHRRAEDVLVGDVAPRGADVRAVLDVVGAENPIRTL